MASLISAGTSTNTAVSITGDTTGALALATNNGTVAVTIGTNQFVGVGTTTPYGQLHLANSSLNGYTYNTQFINQIIESTATAGISIAAGNAQTGGIVFANSNGGSDGYAIYNNASRYMALATGGSERLRINSNGQVLVGTTSATTYYSGASTVPPQHLVVADYDTYYAVSANNTANPGYNFAGPNSAGNRFRYAAIQAPFTTTTAGSEAGALAFHTSSAGGNITEKARIDASGYFKASSTGSYTSGTFHNLVVNNANSYGLIVDNSNATPLSQYNVESRFSAAAPNNTSARFFNAYDSVGTKFLVYGNGGIANYSANNSNLSDRREKTNFAPAKPYLETICAIPVQTFNYKDQNLEEDAGLNLGVVAQDVQTVAPELVTETNWGTQEDPKLRLSIYQTDLQYALMKSIQELKTIVDAQAVEIAALKAKVGA
jgi:Chaperone of endosialidase